MKAWKGPDSVDVPTTVGQGPSGHGAFSFIGVPPPPTDRNSISSTMSVNFPLQLGDDSTKYPYFSEGRLNLEDSEGTNRQDIGPAITSDMQALRNYGYFVSGEEGQQITIELLGNTTAWTEVRDGENKVVGYNTPVRQLTNTWNGNNCASNPDSCRRTISLIISKPKGALTNRLWEAYNVKFWTTNCDGEELVDNVFLSPINAWSETWWSSFPNGSDAWRSRVQAYLDNAINKPPPGWDVTTWNNGMTIDNYWSLSYGSYTKYQDIALSTDLTFKVPQGYQCKAAYLFNTTGSYTKFLPYLSSATDCHIKIANNSKTVNEKGRLVFVELEKQQIRNCTVRLEANQPSGSPLVSHLNSDRQLDLTVHVTGASENPGERVNVSLSRYVNSNTANNKRPAITGYTNMGINLTQSINDLQQYSYQINQPLTNGATCTIGANGTCSLSANITSSEFYYLTEGLYTFHCSIDTPGSRCSGNPFCAYTVPTYYTPPGAICPAALGVNGCNIPRGADSIPNRPAGVVGCDTNYATACQPGVPTTSNTQAGSGSFATLAVACVPQCDQCAAAGTGDGCGGTCAQGASYVAAATPPTITTTGENVGGTYYLTPGGGTMYFDFNTIPAVRLIDSPQAAYQYMLFDATRDTTANAETNAWAGTGAYATGGVVRGSLQETSAGRAVISPAQLDALGRRLTFAVRANYTCPGTSAWATRDFYLQGDIDGTVYESNSCSGGTPVTSIPTGTTFQLNPFVTSAGSYWWPGLSTVAGVTNSITGASITGSAFSLLHLPYQPTESWGPTGYATPAQLRMTLPSISDQLDADPTNVYICTTGGTCTTSGANTTCVRPLTTTTGSQNFYVQSYNLSNDPWWQTWGGLVYGASIESLSPTTTYVAGMLENCRNDTRCDPSLIQTAAGPSGAPPATSLNSGIPMSSTGSISVGLSPDNANYNNRPANEAATGGMTTSMERTDYTYFRNLSKISEIPSPGGSGTTSTINSAMTGPLLMASWTRSEFNNTGEYVHYPTGTIKNLTINLSNTSRWSITGKHVVFVPGDLTITGAGTGVTTDSQQANLLGVATGSYLAFIVGGDITIAPSVGYLDPTDPLANYDTLIGRTTPNISGVFIADGELTIATNGGSNPTDRKFIGGGTFVGWGGVNLDRSFDDTANLRRRFNNLTPTDVFVFRPDFVVNTPKVLQVPKLNWGEAQ